MDRTEAQRVLGLSDDEEPAAIRDAHRRRIREAHPDLGGTTREAARVNEAFQQLSRTTPDTAPKAPPSSTSDSPLSDSPLSDSPVPPEDVDRWFHIAEHPHELLERLAEAGHAVGEVVFVDRHVGLLEIVVGDAPGVGQLAVMVGTPDDRGTPVSFTLDPLGVTPAPPINDVVGALMAELDRI